MNNYDELINTIENELNLIEELIELVDFGSSLYLVLDSKKEVYVKIKNLFLEKSSNNKKLMTIFKN